MTTDAAAESPAGGKKTPLVYLFREGLDPNVICRALLDNLGVHTEVFYEPRIFLQHIKQTLPGACVIDFTTPKIEVATALVKAIRSVLGATMPILALVPHEGGKIIEGLGVGGNTNWIETPLVEGELATKLSAYVTTEQIVKHASAPSIKTVKGPEEIPPLFNWIFEAVVPLLIELGEFVKFDDDAERQLKFYVDKMKGYEEQVCTMVQKLRRKPEKLDVLQSMRAYGVANSRNLVTTMALVNLTVPRSFGFDPKNAMPTHDPKLVIPYSMRIIDRFGEGSRYYTIAFSSALVLDVLARLAQSLGERKRAVLKAIDAAYVEAIRRIEKGFKLGKQADDLALAKHIITTIMLREAGKIAMTMYFENYSEVRKFFDKKFVSHPFQIIAETENYGVSHNMAAAIICQAAPNISEAYLATLFCDIPVPLKGPGEKDTQALAAFCRTL